MIKLVTFLKRAPTLTRQDFAIRWKTVHAPLAAVFPGLRGYMLGFSLDGDEPPADGVAQLWFDSRAAAQISYASEIGRRGSADANAYLARREHLLASEHWLTCEAPLSATPFKLLVSLKRPAEQRREAFCAWLLNDVPNGLRQVCNAQNSRVSVDEKGQLLNSRTQGSLELVAGEAVFDGMIELWFSSAAKAHAARTDLLPWAADALAPRSVAIEYGLLEEHVVVQPPPPAYGLETGIPA